MCGRYVGVVVPSSRWAGGDMLLALQVSDIRNVVLVLVMDTELGEEVALLRSRQVRSR